MKKGMINGKILNQGEYIMLPERRKKLMILSGGVLIISGLLVLSGVWSGKCAKNEEREFVKGIGEEGNLIIGKWKSIAIERDGERVILNELDEPSLIIKLEINKQGQATMIYEGYTVIGKIRIKKDKYVMDTDEDATIEVTIDQDKLLVNIIEEPLAGYNGESFYWVCERTK